MRLHSNKLDKLEEELKNILPEDTMTEEEKKQRLKELREKFSTPFSKKELQEDIKKVDPDKRERWIELTMKYNDLEEDAKEWLEKQQEEL